MNVLVITRRELSGFLHSPFSYFVWTIYLLITGLTFFFTAVFHQIATLSEVLHVSSILFLFIAPLLTMRLLSKDARTGNLELLFTAPVRDWEIVIGKFLAAFLFLNLMLISTIVYVALLTSFGQLDMGATLSGYVGAMLLGGVLISLGMFASSLSAHLVVAVILSVVFSLSFWLIGGLGTVIRSFGYLFSYLSIQTRFTEFTIGIITVNNLVFFLSVTMVVLFFTTHVIQNRR